MGIDQKPHTHGDGDSFFVFGLRGLERERERVKGRETTKKMTSQMQSPLQQILQFPCFLLLLFPHIATHRHLSPSPLPRPEVVLACEERVSRDMYIIFGKKKKKAESLGKSPTSSWSKKEREREMGQQLLPPSFLLRSAVRASSDSHILLFKKREFHFPPFSARSKSLLLHLASLPPLSALSFSSKRRRRAGTNLRMRKLQSSSFPASLR